ncbi:unnamed protein product [Rotaria socialis]
MNKENFYFSYSILLSEKTSEETRRQAAAEAANRRLQQSERRGVDEDELRRMKQRQNERERIEKQLSKLPKQADDSGGLRWQTN